MRRFKEHTSGNANSAAYLRMHRPKYVVYLEEVESRHRALQRELEMKKNRKLKMKLVGSRRDIREVIESEASYR